VKELQAPSLPKYQAYLSQKGYAWYSVNRHHNYTVKEYIQFIRTQGINDFKETTVVQILAYKSYLEGRENKVVGGKLQGKTIYDQLRGLDLLYEYLQIIGRVSHNPVSEIEFKAPPNNQRRITVTESQIKQLYRACKHSKERAVLSLNYGCGLRVGELEKLELGDLKIDDGYLIVRKGKGNKRRSVPMSIGVIKDMINYLKIGRPRLTTERAK